MIVVTGMHRSGTSLAALLLRELGADFGPESSMYAADDWNEHGYLERADVVDLNSRAITGFDRTTGRVHQAASQVSYLARAMASRPSGLTSELPAKATALGNELSATFVKDPRFCLTFPAWQHVTAIDGLVVALRHPSASIASLQRRNRIPSALGHRFWRWHMAALLDHIDDETLVLRQEDLVGDGLEESIDRTRRWLAIRGIDGGGDPRSVVDRSLVHHEPSDEQLPAQTLHVWQRLSARRGFG